MPDSSCKPDQHTQRIDQQVDQSAAITTASSAVKRSTIGSRSRCSVYGDRGRGRQHCLAAVAPTLSGVGHRRGGRAERLDNHSDGCRLRYTSQQRLDRPEARGGACVDHICALFPLLPGKTEDARAFQRELDTERKAEYDRSERRIGITKEVWYIASVPGGDQLVAYMESGDFNRALQLFVESRDEFDQWFKRRLAEVTGLDMNNLPPDMRLPELVSRYEA